MMKTTIPREDRPATRAMPEAATGKPFRLITVGGDGPRPGIDLDRPRAIEVDDDEARFGRRGS